VWLGVSMLFHSVQMGLKLSKMTNKVDQAFNTLSIRREKAIAEAVKALGSKELI